MPNTLKCRSKKKKKSGCQKIKKIKRQVSHQVIYDETTLERKLCLASYKYFVQKFWHVVCQEKLHWNWHMSFLCAELQEYCEAIFRGETREHDLVINISPGSSKSLLCSVLLQAWCWARMPSMRHICGSHTEALVYDLSRKSRDVIKSDLYRSLFPYITMSETQDTKGHYVNTCKGERFSCTIGGKTPTGMHAHLIVIDDPLDPQKANSELELKLANDWMDATLPTRKVNKAVTGTILVMQRLHEDDPAGRMLKKKKVRAVILPAELTQNVKPPFLKKYYRNNPDKLMDPVRMPKSVLEEHMEQGEYHYASQFLQVPIPIGGGNFKVGRILIEKQAPKRFVRLCRYWDKAGTKDGGHYTVGLLMGLDKDGFIWILDVIRGQWDSAVREKKILQTAKMDGKGVIIGLEQEGGSGGKESVEASIRRLGGYRIRVNKPSGSSNAKPERAEEFSVQVNFGNVRYIEANWNDTLTQELMYFPNGKYDDQVDACTGAYSVISGRTFGKKRIISIGAA